MANKDPSERVDIPIGLHRSRASTEAGGKQNLTSQGQERDDLISEARGAPWPRSSAQSSSTFLESTTNVSEKRIIS
jgi:hypothetical protein